MTSVPPLGPETGSENAEQIRDLVQATGKISTLMESGGLRESDLKIAASMLTLEQKAAFHTFADHLT